MQIDVCKRSLLCRIDETLSYENLSFTPTDNVERMTIDNGVDAVHSICYCTFTESWKSRQPVFELRISTRQFLPSLNDSRFARVCNKVHACVCAACYCLYLIAQIDKINFARVRHCFEIHWRRKSQEICNAYTYINVALIWIYLVAIIAAVECITNLQFHSILFIYIFQSWSS